MAANSFSNARFRRARISFVVSSTSTAPRTWSSIQTGCAAESTTARESGVTRQRVASLPASAFSISGPSTLVGARLDVLEVLAGLVEQVARQRAHPALA